MDFTLVKSTLKPAWQNPCPSGSGSSEKTQQSFKHEDRHLDRKKKKRKKKKHFLEQSTQLTLQRALPLSDETITQLATVEEKKSIKM